LSLVLNDRRHYDDVTSDGGLFQVLAAATATDASISTPQTSTSRAYVCGTVDFCVIWN